MKQQLGSGFCPGVDPEVPRITKTNVSSIWAVMTCYSTGTTPMKQHRDLRTQGWHHIKYMWPLESSHQAHWDLLSASFGGYPWLSHTIKWKLYTTVSVSERITLFSNWKATIQLPAKQRSSTIIHEFHAFKTYWTDPPPRKETKIDQTRRPNISIITISAVLLVTSLFHKSTRLRCRHLYNRPRVWGKGSCWLTTKLASQSHKH